MNIEVCGDREECILHALARQRVGKALVAHGQARGKALEVVQKQHAAWQAPYL